MDRLSVSPIVSWSTILSGIVALAGFAFLVIFYAVEAQTIMEQGESGPPLFGTLNDASYILVPLLLLPLAVTVFRRSQLEAPTLSLLELVTGVVGLLAMALLQALYVPRIIQTALQAPGITVAFGVMGAWLVVAAWLARQSMGLPVGLSRLGLFVGAAMVLLPIGYWVGGGLAMIEDSEAALNIPAVVMLMLSMLAIGLGFPLWLILTGRWLLKG